MLSSHWDIGLDSWVIQDGNYGDFWVGQVTAFALKCSGTLRPRDGALKHARSIEPGRYAIQGAMLSCAQDVSVVDFGIRAYYEEALPEGVETGSNVVGDIDLSIDYYLYQEFLRAEQAFPALEYQWRIDGISLLVAPFIACKTPWGAPAQTRDRTRATYTALERTNAWEDEDGLAEYVLQCTLLDPEPRR